MSSQNRRKHTTKFRSKSSVNFEKNLFSRDTRSLVSCSESQLLWLFSRGGLVNVCTVEFRMNDTPR